MSAATGTRYDQLHQICRFDDRDRVPSSFGPKTLDAATRAVDGEITAYRGAVVVRP